MIGDILQPTHLLLILVVALLVLGPKRLPEVARQLGNGLRDFKSAISGEEHHHEHGHEGVHQPAPPPYETIESVETPPPLVTHPEPADREATEHEHGHEPEEAPAPAPAPAPEHQNPVSPAQPGAHSDHPV